MKTLNSFIIIPLIVAAAGYACSGSSTSGEPGTAGTAGTAGRHEAGAAGESTEGGSAGAGEVGGDSAAGSHSESGAGGASGNDGDGPVDGTSGAGGESQASLVGIRVSFLGGPQVHGTSSEADLVQLITSETGVSPTRVHGGAGAPTLVATDLANTDVLVIESLLRVYDTPEATLVANWVAAGHGLIVMNGYTSDSTRAGVFASSYGVTFGPYLQPVDPAYVSALAPHPLTVGVSSLYFLGGFAMTSSDPAAVPFASLSVYTVGLALAHGSGRVAFWGDDWIVLTQEIVRVDAEGAHPTAVFWKNALRWATKRD